VRHAAAWGVSLVASAPPGAPGGARRVGCGGYGPDHRQRAQEPRGGPSEAKNGPEGARGEHGANSGRWRVGAARSGYACSVTVAAYVRVSSRSQDGDTQRSAIERMAQARGEPVGSWFVETRRATRVAARPSLDELRGAVRRGEVRTVYVFRLDRFSRLGIRDMLQVLDELRGNGCKVHSVSDGFDLEGPMGDVHAAMMAWAAQVEGIALGERIAAARVRVEASGGHWGRPARAGDELADKVRAMAAEKIPIRKIAIALKVPKSTVGAILSGKGPYDPARSHSRKPGLKKARAPASE